MKFRKLTTAKFLQGIGRDLLGELFARFSEELAGRNVAMPAAGLDDAAYFKALAGLAMAPEGLPDNLIETLLVIEEMSNPEGQERIEEAAQQGRLVLKCGENCTHGDIAMQAYLSAPAVLTQKHNEMLLTRLSSFEYFSSRAPVDRRASFLCPAPDTLELLTADLDHWFNAHSRGEQTAWIDIFPMDGEFWFLVRHGDTYGRKAKVEKRHLEILHFRPAKDDVVVYSPERDEVRINAGTKGEKELYRRAFGRRLFGDAGYFSERKAYTLEVLRSDQADALDTHRVAGIDRIVLREVTIAWAGAFNEAMTLRADDLFAAAQATARFCIPDGGRVVGAAFDFYFMGEKKPRKVAIRPPNVLRLGRHCDAALVQQWLSAMGFREVLMGAKAA